MTRVNYEVSRTVVTRIAIAMLVLAFDITPIARADDLAKLQPWTGGDTPKLSLRDIKGNSHELANYRGRLVLLNFWATWCGPCVEEMPSLARLAKNLSGEPFALLTVNFGEQTGRIKPFMKKHGLALPVLLDSDMSVSRAWVKKGLPTTFIIGADQNIRYQVLGELTWDAPEVEERIRELLPKD